MKTKEIWKPIDSYHDISSLGRLRSWTDHNEGRRKRPRILQGYTNHGGYLYTDFTWAKHRQIHRLVLEAFIGPCPPGMETRHLNGNPSDNRLSNLAWGTKKSNAEDTLLHGRSNRGERNPGAVLTEKDVLQIAELRKTHKWGSKTIKERAFPGIAESIIKHIIRGDTWSWLTGFGKK